MRIASRAFTHLSWRNELPGLAVVACIAVVYWMLVPPFVLGGDNGEFALLASVNGIAHPPGYPLYVAWLRVLNGLPAASPAQAAGYATAVLAVAQMLVLYAAVRAWAVAPLLAAIAVAFYAGSPLAIQHFTHAEVFALNGLIVAGLLLVCSPSVWIEARVRLVALGLLCGLGFAHHHSFVLAGPLIIYGFVVAFLNLKNRARSWTIVVVSCLAFCLGLGLNLLLIVWSQRPDVYLNSFGLIRDFDDLLWHFLRRDYGTFDLAASSGGAVTPVWLHLSALLASMWSAWKFLLPLTAIAFLERLRRDFWLERSRWWAWVALLLCLLAAGPLFFSRANMGVNFDSPSAEVLQRFYLLPNQFLVIPAAEGMRLCCQLLLRMMPRSFAAGIKAPSRLRPFLLAVVAAYFFCFNAVVSIAATRSSRADYTQRLVENGLARLPRGAVVLVRADDELFASSYMQSALGFRPDLILINTSFLQKEWYAKRLSDRILRCPWPKTSVAGFYKFLINECRRDVFVSLPEFYSDLGGKLYSRQPNYQYGVFRRLLPSGASVPPPERIFELNTRLFQSYRLPPVNIPLARGWSSQPGLVYWTTWRRIGLDMRQAARPDLARKALQKANTYGFCQKGSCLSE